VRDAIYGFAADDDDLREELLGIIGPLREAASAWG